MFGHLLKRGAAMLCFAAVLALPAYAEGRITTDMTMKEIRSDPAIAGSGVSTYCKGDADSLALRRLYENKTLLDYVGETTAQDSADGLNIVIENYEAGKQVTWQVYSPEESQPTPRWAVCSCSGSPARMPMANMRWWWAAMRP